MKLHVSLTDVPQRGCAKPSCKWNRAPLHRHHKAHQALWFGPWARRHAESQWRAFVKRYHEFRPADVVVLCENHHAEIHSIYDEIISDDVAKLGIPLYKYSWKQGRILMRRLEDACAAWLLDETPGIDSKLYGSTRKLRWNLLKRKAKKKHSTEAKPKKKKKRKKARRRRN